MFDLAWSELAIIGVVALVVVGPKDLPKLMRSAGQMAAKARRIADEFKGQVNDAMREAELDDLKGTVADLKALNPSNMIRSELSKLAEPVREVTAEMKSEFDAIGSSVTAADDAVPPPDLAKIEVVEPVDIVLPEPMPLDGMPDIELPVSPDVAAASQTIEPERVAVLPPRVEADAKA